MSGGIARRLYRLKDGKITEVWSEAKFLGLIGQISKVHQILHPLYLHQRLPALDYLPGDTMNPAHSPSVGCSEA